MPVFTSLTSFNTFQERLRGLKSQNGWVVLYFTADWCHNCRKIDPIIENELLDIPENVEFYILDVDFNFEIYGMLKSKRQVNGVPNILAYNSTNFNGGYLPDICIIGSQQEEVKKLFKVLKGV